MFDDRHDNDRESVTRGERDDVSGDYLPEVPVWMRNVGPSEDY